MQFSPPCIFSNDLNFKTKILNGLNFTWKTIIGPLIRSPFYCQAHETSGEKGIELFISLPIHEEAPEKEPLGFLGTQFENHTSSLVQETSDSRTLRWVAEGWHQRMRKRANIPFCLHSLCHLSLPLFFLLFPILFSFSALLFCQTMAKFKSDGHQTQNSLALVCTPNSCILFLLLFAFSRAYNHEKHCNLLASIIRNFDFLFKKLNHWIASNFE